MRTYDELFRSAMSLRYKLMEERRDPAGSVFTVTQHEHAILKMQDCGSLSVDHVNKTFCGFKLHVI